MTKKLFSKEVRKMKRMVIIMILTLGMVAIGFRLYCGKAQAGEGCGTWEGIPTITMKVTDRKMTYEQCLKAKEVSTCGQFLTIAITDVGKFHGDVCAGSSFGFRACQIAFAHLYPGEIPPRGDQFVVMNSERSCPTDAISYVTGARYGKGAPATGIRNKNIVFDSAIPSFSFIFSSMSTGKSIKLVSRFALPKEFMELREKTFSRKATAEEEEKFLHMGQCLSLYILTAPENEIFEIVSLPNFSWKEYKEKNVK
jgi:formylmethanofuran dehydrogenase subunit E